MFSTHPYEKDQMPFVVIGKLHHVEHHDVPKVDKHKLGDGHLGYPPCAKWVYMSRQVGYNSNS